MLKNPHCSKVMSAEHRSKFAAFHRQWGRLQMREKFSSGAKNPKQTNKQTNIPPKSKSMCLKETLSYMTKQKTLLEILVFKKSESVSETQMPPIMAISKDGQVHKD